ncbi:hypothetical protein N8199_07655 [Emcibacteraceae bacterium]|nr:hypothetical protein [Emcibacteraceae bacterium]
MLGWEIFIQTIPTDTHKEVTIATWATGMRGTDWLDELAKIGKAQDFGGNGYPVKYSAKVKDLLPILSLGAPEFKGTTVIGDDYVIKAGPSWNVKIHEKELSKLEPEETLIIEAWDQS